MAGRPDHAAPLTAQSCLVLMAAGVCIRSRRALVALTAGALVSWTAVAVLLCSATLHAADWISTWVIAVVIAVAAQLVTGTERSVEQKVRREAQSSSLRDPLTGLVNRRGFVLQAELLLGQADRLDRPLWCAFVDVDHFKVVNDALGHEAGDEVLVAVAAALTATARSSDLVARWGGDEFVVLGMGSPPDEHDLQSRVVAHLSGLPDSVTTRWPPSVTVGAAAAASTSLAGDRPLRALFAEADARMYERRRTIRADQVSSYTLSPASPSP